MKTACAASLAALVSAIACAQEPGTRFDAAREAYDRGHYRSAFDTYAALADEGHCDAARVAWQMSRWGPRLYAQAFAIDAGRMRRWQSQQACTALVVANSGMQR